jgi:hypothetical protein
LASQLAAVLQDNPAPKVTEEENVEADPTAEVQVEIEAPQAKTSEQATAQQKASPEAEQKAKATADQKAKIEADWLKLLQKSKEAVPKAMQAAEQPVTRTLEHNPKEEAAQQARQEAQTAIPSGLGGMPLSMLALMAGCQRFASVQQQPRPAAAQSPSAKG